MAKNRITVTGKSSLLVPLYVFRGGKRGAKYGITISCRDPRYSFAVGAAKFGKLTVELEKMLSDLIDSQTGKFSN